MTELENKICAMLSDIKPCTCDVGTCTGEHPSKSCKVYIARSILELVRNHKDTCESCPFDYGSVQCGLCDRYVCHCTTADRLEVGEGLCLLCKRPVKSIKGDLCL